MTTVAYFAGIYQGILLLSALLFICVYPRILKDYHPSLLRMTGITLLSEFTSSVLATIIIAFNWTSPTTNYLGCMLDGIVSGMIILNGVTLFTKMYPTRRHILNVMWPYLAPILFIYFQTTTTPVLLGAYIIIVFTLQITILGYKIHVYDKKLKNDYSDIENRTTQWYFVIIGMAMVEVYFWYYIQVMHTQSVYFKITFFAYMLVVWSILVGFACIQRKGVDDENQEATITEENINVSDDENESSSQTNILQEKIENLLRTTRFYLNPDLDRASLAKMLNTNRTYLSQYFSEQNTTFYDYINRLRIEEAKRLMRSTDYTIETIAQECGYGSARTFTRVFSKYENESPGEWRKIHITQ